MSESACVPVSASLSLSLSLSLSEGGRTALLGRVLPREQDELFQRPALLATRMARALGTAGRGRGGARLGLRRRQHHPASPPTQPYAQGLRLSYRTIHQLHA